MNYKIVYSSSFERDLKSFKKDKRQKQDIKLAIDEILENPLSGNPMSGNFDRFFKYAFSDKPSIRILYVLYPCCQTGGDSCKFIDNENLDEDSQITSCIGVIHFVFVKTREACNNLYQRSKKDISNFLLD